MKTCLAIFDFDGTLGDTRRNIVLTMRDTMRELGLPVAGGDACAATVWWSAPAAEALALALSFALLRAARGRFRPLPVRGAVVVDFEP